MALSWERATCHMQCKQSAEYIIPRLRVDAHFTSLREWAPLCESMGRI